MKKLTSLLRQHAEVVSNLPTITRIAGTVTSLLVLIPLLYINVTPLLVGLIMSTMALAWQLRIGAWDLSKDKAWMLIFSLWYMLLYTGLALLF